jgi:hypothetical protein
MATKKSVFLSDYTVKWIEYTTKKKLNGEEIEGAKWSESINATFEQFRFLIRGSLPELTMEEWTIILNVYAGCYFPAHGVPCRIASDIMDDIGEFSIEAVEKLMPEKAELIRKVHAMSQLEQLAMLYFVQIFWSNDWPMKQWNEIEKEIRSLF